MPILVTDFDGTPTERDCRPEVERLLDEAPRLAACIRACLKINRESVPGTP